MSYLETDSRCRNASRRTPGWQRETRERDERLVELVRSGVSIRSAAKVVGLGKSRATEIVKLYDVPIRSVGRPRNVRGS